MMAVDMNHIEIVKILEKGTCPYGHKAGDTFMYPEQRGNLCAAALNECYDVFML